jgi:hypothetical protein
MRSDLRMASPWVRKLLGAGAAARICDNEVVATISQGRGGKWLWSAGTRTGTATDRDEAKRRADAMLAAQGFTLIDVRGGCIIEDEKPAAKMNREFREG